MSMPKLKDVDLRIAAHERLFARANQCPDTLVIDELGLSHGACRVDIAVINGHIRAYEIKAEADNLLRLPRQVEAYSEVVDAASLIVTKHHLDAAVKLVPEWWGVILAERRKTGDVAFRRVRKEYINRGALPLTLVKLLWRTEVADLLRQYGISEKELRAPRAILYELLVSILPRRTLGRTVRETLKSRKTWRDRARPL